MKLPPPSQIFGQIFTNRVARIKKNQIALCLAARRLTARGLILGLGLFGAFFGTAAAGELRQDQIFADQTSTPDAFFTDNLTAENSTLENLTAEAVAQDWQTLPWGVNLFDEINQLDPAHGEQVRQIVEETGQELSKTLAQAQQEGKPFVVWVNIPTYTLRVFNSATGEELLHSRVIVGSPGSKTPTFSTNIINLKFNPDWSPPASLQRKGRTYTPSGPRSPLGEVRFSTDNNQNIYLHDTNDRSLYAKDNRALSAGCVRVEKWHELSQILSFSSKEQIDQYTDGHRIQFLDVPKSLVWISYQRIDLDEQGMLMVFDDPYRRQSVDAALAEAINARNAQLKAPPVSEPAEEPIISASYDVNVDL